MFCVFRHCNTLISVGALERRGLDVSFDRTSVRITKDGSLRASWSKYASLLCLAMIEEQVRNAESSHGITL